jgi:hypothetical protein
VIAAYNSGSIMARTLESLEPGTPLLAGPTRVGTVAGVYTDGDSRAAELIVAHWDALDGEVVIPAAEIERISERGVHLMRQEADQYADLAPFDAARFPTLRKLK